MTFFSHSTAKNQDIEAIRAASLMLGRRKVAGIMGCGEGTLDLCGAYRISSLRGLVNELAENGLGRLAVSIVSSLCEEAGTSVISGFGSSPAADAPESIAGRENIDAEPSLAGGTEGIRKLLLMIESEIGTV